jgi:dTDP-4-dehydrorhamnose reductase
MILVTGGTGQLARALADAGGERVRVVGRPAFDFDRPDTIAPVLEEAAPSLVINAAAYTAVDRAESEPDAARRANAEGPGLIAAWCAAAGAPLIHVSTDYVFDGTKGAPYVETDPTSPTGVYGRTKRDGEDAVLGAGGLAIVLRTSWVYAATGRNFVLTMLNAARARPSLRVVADQIGCPTATPDLAAAILAVAEQLEIDADPALAGIYHAAGEGETSWHGLAVAALECAGLATPVEPIATADWPTPARRPADSRLDCGKLAAVFGLRLPPWRDSLAAVVGDAIRG